jgi:hypothetical protein
MNDELLSMKDVDTDQLISDTKKLVLTRDTKYIIS